MVVDGAELTVWHHHPTVLIGLLNAGGYQAVLVENENEATLFVRLDLPNAGWHGYNVAVGGALSACLAQEHS